VGRVEEMLAKQGAALSNGDKPANAASKEAAKELARTGTSTYKEKSYSAPVKVQKKKSKTTSSTTTTSKGSPGAAGGRVEAMLAEKGASPPKEKAAKTTAQPVKKTAAPLKAPKTTAKKVIRVPVKQTDPSAYGYDPMVAQDLENRQKQTSALKPGAKPFSAGKLAGDLAMRGMNLFAGFFSSGLAMAEDAGGYAAGLLTGQPGVNLAEGGIFNTWDQAIKREGQAMEQSAAKNVAKGGKAAETVYKYGTQTVAAMPQAVLAMLTGGGSAVASSASLASTAAKALSPSLARTISQAVSGMAKNPQYWTSFAQVVGPGYQQALEDGADHAHAALYAVGNGLLNAAVEIGGGVQKLPGALKDGTATWKAIVDSMLEEGQEEVVQGIIERALQNVVYDQKNPLASASNPRAVLNPRTALEEFKGGAVVGGILGGGQAAVQAGINSYAQNQVQKHLDMMQSIVKERAAEIQSIQKQAEQEAADWIESLNIPRPVDLNAVNAQADQDASAIVRDMFSQKPVQPTSPESVMKIIQDIQREQQARPGSILLNGDQLTQINQEIAKQQAATVDVDSLLKGRARLDYEQLSPDTQAAVDRAYEQGTAGMDAEGRIFRIHPEDHIDRRDAADIGRRRSLNAFQFDHPELHHFFAGAAQWLKSGMGQKGGQIESTPGVLSDGVTPSSHDRYWRTSRMQPEPVVRLLDEFGLSYAEIDKALDAIIKDRGQENYAAAKKVELVLDEMLTNGWTDLDGRYLPGIPEYVDATSKIAGSLNAEQEPDLGIMGQEIERLYGKSDTTPSDGLGAADAGTVNTDYDRLQAQSSEFHPEGENPARPVDVPKQDFDGRNIPKAASTVTGAEILNNADVERLQQIIADGMISFDTIHDTDAQSAARQTVSEIGFEGALERYRQAARSNVATKNNVALGQLLMKMAAQSGNESALAEIFYLYTTNSTNIAQAMQAQRMLRKLSPESQLSALQRSVNQLNERYDVPETIRQASNGISAEDALAAYQAVSDAYRDVLSAYQNVVDTMHGAFEDAANTERHPNTPGWAEQLGRDLARNARNRAGLGGEKQGPSFYSTLLNDLTSLMNEHVPKRTGERTKRTAADKIADLFANRAEYARAWEQAKTELAERYKDNPEALDALDDFLNASMGYNGAGPDTTMMRAVAEAALSNDVKLKELVVRGKYDADALVEQLSNTLIQETNASGTDAGIIRDAVRRYIQNRGESSSRSASDYLRSDVRRVMRDIGVKMSDIIQSRPGTKAETLDRITSMLTGEYGVSEQAAAKIANDIAADFEQMVRERSRARLEQMFKDRPERTKKTLSDKFEELVNLGAFSGNEFSQQTVKKLFGVGTGVEVSPELIRKFMAQEDQNGRDAVMDEIVKDLASQLPSTFRAKYDCLRYLAMLGNPRTHIRNILGNTLFQIPVTAKNRVGAAVEAGYNFFSGGRLERTKSLTGVNPASQLAKECRADWSNVSDFLSGSKYSEGRITARDIESEIDPFQNSNPLFKGLGKLSDMNGQLLSVEDTAAKRWIYTQSLAGYLKANGIKSISEADPQLLNRARNYAAQEAMRNTFNDHNAFSDFVAKLSALPNSENKWARRAGYVTEGLLPFKRTPANILSRAVEYSPVGAAASIADLVNRGVRGQATVESVATGIDRLAAGLTGTVLLAVGFLLNGYFSGGDDEDDKQRDFNSLTGHQSYALELENGTSVTLDWLAPEAIPFFMGVELAHAWQDGGLSWEDALNALKNMSGPMLEMSMLQGLNDVIEDASYAQYHGGNVPAAFIVSAATNYATQIFPTLFGQLERSTENRRMTTYADKNSPIAKDLQFFLGKTSQKIPGLDYHQIPYIDEWGREESSGDPISRTFNNILNPAYMSQVQIDNVEKELQRLKDTTGNSSVFPAKVDKSFKVGDEMKYLTADEYTTFAKTVGQTRRDLLDRLMKQPGYKRLSDEQKAQAVASVYEYATGKGKMEVSKWKPDDSSIVKGVLKSMLPVESYILYRLNSDRDKSGSVNGAESALTLLELNGLSNQQRGKAWDALNDIKEDKNPFIGTLPEAGVQSKTAIDIYDRYRELNNARMKPKDKAAEFLSYVRGLGLTSEQLKAVKNTYTFFGSYPIEW